MSDRDLPKVLDESVVVSKVGIACQFDPLEHRSIIAAIAGGEIRDTSSEGVICLPKLMIGQRQNPRSPIDALRDHVDECDRIKPFEPISSAIPSALRRYDPSSENYWKDVDRTIDLWKHPTFLSPLGEALLKPPHAKPGYHFRLNPNTGRIEETKDHLTMDYRPELDGYNDGRPQYELDPNTGGIRTRRNDWRSDRDGWQQKDHYYGLNPETGKIELRPNVRTMDFSSR